MLNTASYSSSSQIAPGLSNIRIEEPPPATPIRVPMAQTLPSRRNWLILAMADHAAATFDAYSTRAAISRGAVEADPFMRPFAGSSGIYAAIQVCPVLLDYTAHRMQHSEHSLLRKTWWAPQSVGTAVYLFSGVHNLGVVGRK